MILDIIETLIFYFDNYGLQGLLAIMGLSLLVKYIIGVL